MVGMAEENNLKTTTDFIITVAEVNKISRSYGFRNGIHWAEKAERVREINPGLLAQFRRCSEMYTKVQGFASTKNCVNEALMDSAKTFYSCVLHSKLRNQKQKPVLPEGTFRFEPYVKQFYWKGLDGEPYDFRFEIVNQGSRDNPDYRIDIIDAPHFKKGQKHPHRFHILGAFTGSPYICWDTTITAFDKANAVMIVWAQNYKKELDKKKQEEGWGNSDCKAERKKIYLPDGIFRNDCAELGAGDDGSTDNGAADDTSSEEAKTVFFEKSVYNQILEILGTKKPELGGMLGFSEEQNLITDFVFDDNARVNHVEYNPNTKFLNSVINGKWADEGISVAGFVHSHPGHFNRLSGADVEYAARICKELDMQYLVMPIVTSSADSETSITGFLVTRDEGVLPCNIEVLGNDACCDSDEAVSQELLEKAQAELEVMNQKYTKKTDPLAQDETFARISTSIPLDYMEECTIIGVGCGGARGFYEDMARCGVGKFILIDGDISSRSNIASQNGYISEIGKNKAFVVESRLRDINEYVAVKAVDRMLDDNISDEDFGKLMEEISAEEGKTLLCAFTDSFDAQARCQKLATKFKLPLLAAQHHAYGDSSEVLYWYPGLSKYNQEDILATRYEAYANGFKNDVTSVGSPIFNTTRLNALCEKIAIGIFLYKADVNSRYSSFLRYNSDRNLILVRQKCLDYTDSVIDELFPHGDRSHFDDVVWLNPEEIW